MDRRRPVASGKAPTDPGLLDSCLQVPPFLWQPCCELYPGPPFIQAYTYWVQWAAGEHPQGDHDPRGHQANQTRETNHTYYEVQALEPGTLYNFSVWAERSNVASSAQGLLESTAPSPVTITSCISISGGHGVVLTWSCPRGGYEAFELQVGGQQDSQNRSSCGKRVSVWGLWPAQSYPAIVTTIWDEMRAPSASMTATTNIGEQSPTGMGAWNEELAEPHCQGHGHWRWGRCKCTWYPGDTFVISLITEETGDERPGTQHRVPLPPLGGDGVKARRGSQSE
ncbi:receptor-type tyrosine-protein phosphatase H-like [Mustela putorius furo]|uniref:Receptor-type tyrosine-protein phosphatase H-like n=1 Tax=Mustela putorius furo TaxID=9669 RepID=A0A8U0S1C6_MUSPF|nr:receptor-type tyrosine-protein phosphatase H-like [Mustela putorius furo]